MPGCAHFETGTHALLQQGVHCSTYAKHRPEWGPVKRELRDEPAHEHEAAERAPAGECRPDPARDPVSSAGGVPCARATRGRNSGCARRGAYLGALARDGRPGLLGRLIDDQFTFISPDGAYEDRKSYLAGYRELAEGRIQVQRIELDNVKLRLLGDTGIVTGHVLAHAKMGDTLIAESVLFTRVYQRRGERWRMVAGQGTRLAPAASPR
jgi:hypothetical protein